ncbi:hypothetical protein [Roseinatronobacter alkalisoli]|uniref:Adenylate kinase n=1 Tax=Roseinatronobacter alkalisoli TaxID=3028235 RepID=A0ABT5THT4_9RHOB|nr:hypothetical protein [Roseinatronobacter sp. HJB301]MDD7973757.1 hypothetical protein [Roseinatronobacter sp. HJB301]
MAARGSPALKQKTEPAHASRASRIYIIGASCAGVTSLGRRLAQRCNLTHVDVDDFGWDRMDESFPRDQAKCVDRIRRSLPVEQWVLTGPVEGWGDELVGAVDLIGFVVAPTPVRLQRLLNRDRERYGGRIGPDGDRYALHMAAYWWARQYDDPTFPGSNRLSQEEWLITRESSVVRLDGTLPLNDNVDRLLIGFRRQVDL